MVNYLVSVDDSRTAQAAFWTAIQTVSQNPGAHLTILNVVQHIEPHLWSLIPSDAQQMEQESLKDHSRKVLNYYGRFAKAAGVQYTCVMALSNNISEMIVQQTKDRAIDFLIMGNRSKNVLEKLLMGSSTKYCIDNCSCNVLVVKGEWGPSEVHDISKQDVIKIEEAERRRRIREDEMLEEKAKFESKLDLNIVRLAEETERKARIADLEADKEDREAVKKMVIEAEEKERSRRMSEEAIIDDRTHHVQIYPQNIISS
eukprot:TRINITY_DN437_c0_g1_i1.p1 TRINITY_DN437_c0_g1~~TRINITY_DN437_c0_g1_i1.p1  ORF type:complete len:258 (-),score=77.12 TRINITY_DN437_c0_g1_i1:17-790(-)